MLRPSNYEPKTGLWVWSPDYGDGDNDEEDNDDGTKSTEDGKEKNRVVVKEETSDDQQQQQEEEKEEKEKEEGGGGGDHYEMQIGDEIRFKVKSIQFTQVTNTAKGVQATTTTTAYSQETPKSTKEQDESANSDFIKARPIRKRSTSVDLSEGQTPPASMRIVASICDDGLGPTSWWTSEGGDDEDDDEEEEEEA
jgi:DNA-directed RNA polymerase subunit E'/Rpb7